MREIKFRAKTLKGEWMDFGLFDIETIHENDGVFYLYSPIGSIPCEMGTERQYTGLRDSGFVEEYFGDIIEENDDTRRVIEDEASVVAFRIIGGKNIKYFWDLLPHKVIGNIYENPELLKGQNNG